MNEPRLPKWSVIDQAEWGHPAPYKDYTRWPDYAPTQYVLHWTGSGSNVTTTVIAKLVARNVRKFHVDVRGWSDAAYNAFAWFPLLRLRGSNHNGANKDSNYWGGKTFTVYFPTGTAYPTPHRRMLKGFAFMWALAPAPVTGHKLLPPSPSGVKQDTECPGTWLVNWIRTEGWLDLLADGTQGERASWQAKTLKRRLRQAGYWSDDMGYTPRYNKQLTVAVRSWQINSGRSVTGLMTRDDWRAICS